MSDNMVSYNELLIKYCGCNRELHSLLTAHSEAVMRKALAIAARHPELVIDTEFTAEAAMLHDIGVVRCDAPSIHCLGSEPYLRHGIIGAAILRGEGLERHARVAERHTGAGITRSEIAEHGLPLPPGDYLPETIEEKLICYADKFYSKSRQPDDEKSLEKIRAQMAAYCAETLARFDAMHAIFGN